MPRIDHHDSLQQLAFLYLTIAHRSDDYLSDPELESVTRLLTKRTSAEDRDAMQALVMDALDAYMRSEDVDTVAEQAAQDLDSVLSNEQKEAVLRDLKKIGEADGVLLHEEQSTVARLAALWRIDIAAEAPHDDGKLPWGVLHDLAYIYLVLGHGTDNDLTETELQVMLNKLQEWQPLEASTEMRSIFSVAMDMYARGKDDSRLEQSIASVRDTLPREQRMAALNDLVKIANADGVFLDDEEDLINHLLTEWDVDPFANYGSHGSKE